MANNLNILDHASVGWTASGSPVSGTYAVGDLVYDRGGGYYWACTVAGSPGTWVRVGSSGQELAYAEVLNFSSVAINTTPADAAGLTISPTVGTRPIFIDAYMPITTVGAAGRARLWVLEGATFLQLAESAALAASGSTGSLRAGLRLAPSAGVHTYKVQMTTVTAASGTYTSAATEPAYIRAVEL